MQTFLLASREAVNAERLLPHSAPRPSPPAGGSQSLPVNSVALLAGLQGKGEETVFSCFPPCEDQQNHISEAAP